MASSISTRRTLARAAIAVVAGLVLAAAAPLGASAARSAPASGVGDPYYPNAGNAGYDAIHYALDISYDPASDGLKGRAVITSKATQALKSFNLDLDGLTVSSVNVNGSAAKFSRTGGELTVTPKSALRKGLPFITIVTYSGVPESLDDAGFLATDDGALVIGQPRVASSWFPVNDHPSDKALYTIQLTVPKGLEAISNGRLLSHRDQGGKSVWLWNTDEPMASYLATMTIGQFDVDDYRADGIRYWDAIDPDLMAPSVVGHTGSGFAYSGQGSDSYKRLQQTFTVGADSPSLSLFAQQAIETGWDFAFVEVAPTGSDDWTTLPEEGGAFAQDAGNAACADLLGQHPFLSHYLTENAGGGCDPSGSSGDWWATTGSTAGWNEWSFDLSDYIGQQVDVAITYVTDYVTELDGVSVDDIVGPGGAGTTSFENGSLDGWTVPEAPTGSPGNTGEWTATTVGPLPLGAKAAASLARQPEMLAALESWFGKYPFDELGGIVDDDPRIDFALENQTRPIYSKWFFQNQEEGDSVVVHEVAHQWFGDSVALERWSDIWLNEGFATYAEWLWSEHEGGATPQDFFDYYYEVIPEDDPFWALEIGDPGTESLFDDPVYLRGGMALQALRVTIGDEAFFKLLPRWHNAHENGNATIAQFIALAEKISGQQLDALFDEWLFTGSRPSSPSSGLRTFDVAPNAKIPDFWKVDG